MSLDKTLEQIRKEIVETLVNINPNVDCLAPLNQVAINQMAELLFAQQETYNSLLAKMGLKE